MKTKILLSSMVTAFIFSGCLGLGDAKPSVNKITKVEDKVEAKADKASKNVKDIKKKVETVTKHESVPTPPESLLKDKVIENVVEIGSDKIDNDSAKSQIIESVD